MTAHQFKEQKADKQYGGKYHMEEFARRLVVSHDWLDKKGSLKLLQLAVAK